MSKKAKTAGAVGGVAVAAAAALIMSNAGGGAGVEIPYTVEPKTEYVTCMTVEPPEDASVDIVELYCNGAAVDKALLPDGQLESIPLVFTDYERLELRMYRRGECVGTAEFEGDKLMYKEVGGND